jgi:hypothetical protein
VFEPLVGSGAMGQRLEYGGGLSAATGKFIFTEAATTWTLTNSLQIVGDRWRFGVSIPLISQNSTAITLVGGIPLPTGGPNAGPIGDRTDGEPIPMQKRRSGSGGTGTGAGAGTLRSLLVSSGGVATVVDSGAVEGLGPFETTLGDPIVDLGGDLFISPGGTVRLGAQLFAKIPIADPASGVSTGAVDYGAGASVSMVSGRGIIFADVSHWILGDLEDLPLSDLTTGSIGLGRSFGATRRLSVLASASAATAFVETVDPALSAGLGFGYAVGANRFLTLGATFGLSESVADWSVSLGWRVGVSRPTGFTQP